MAAPAGVQVGGRRQTQGEIVDAVVVGSGFGGSVAAYRLADGGKSVVLLERGRAYPPGSFARSPAEFGVNFWDPSEHLYGLFDTWTFRGMEGIVSSGLGGGSLIYANVLLRKDPEWFVHNSPIPGGGYENWAFGRDDLEPHYDRVERMMGATPYPYDDTPKTMAMETAAHALGLAIQRPPIAVTFGRPDESPGPMRELPEAPYGNLHGQPRLSCSMCGECDIGCNSGAKNTLDHNYLSAAQHAGADLRTLHEVRGFRRVDDGMWEVRYVVHDPDSGHDDPAERTIRCRRLVLAAGTFGSTFLLLRNRASLPGISSALGTRFSGNGDLMAFLMNATADPARVVTRDVVGSRGPVITTAIRVGDEHDEDGSTGRGFYIEDAGYPAFVNWLMETAQLSSVASRTAKMAVAMISNRLFKSGRSNISRQVAAALGTGSFSASTMPLLAMGRDVPDGVMTLDNGRLAIDWTVATSLSYFSRIRETMREMADVLGADFEDNPLWWAKRVITVHPLGGAPIGRNPHEGVCDPYGEVFGNPGLFVLDGAAMPGPVGANPSLTIAALSDRAAERMLERSWLGNRAVPVVPVQGGGDEPSPPPGDESRISVSSVAFTEQMKGAFALGTGDPRRGYADAEVRGQRMMFELTITAADIDRFAADSSHEADATGYLDADMLGGRLEVQRGWFNLLVRPDDSPGRRMLYRLHLSGPGGTPMTFVGFKDIRDDPGFDLWSDTTTLSVQVLNGHIPLGARDSVVSSTGLLEPADSRVIGAGMMRIEPLDFARQLTTFRTTGPNGSEALARFGALFLGALWETYAPPAKKRETP